MPEIDYNALGQAIDTTWGRSSTPKTATYSVKFKMAGPDVLVASYASIISFKSHVELKYAKDNALDESNRVLDELIRQVKAAYKDLSGKSIALKDISETKGADGLEIIGRGVITNPMRKAYYRRTVTFQIG
jgi:hypothetical protein